MKYTLEIRKAVLEYQSKLPQNYDVFVTTDNETFKKLVSGQMNIKDGNQKLGTEHSLTAVV